MSASLNFTGPRTDKHRDFMPPSATVIDLEPTSLRMPPRPQQATQEPATATNGPNTSGTARNPYSGVITDLVSRRDKLSHEVNAVSAAISALEAL